MRVLLLHGRIRLEEKHLLRELEGRGVTVVRRHLDHLVLAPEGPLDPEIASSEVVLDRGVRQTASRATIGVLEAAGLPCVNSSAVHDTCGDKLATNLALASAGLPVPRARVAFDADSALAACEELGYPCVIKPTVGSWGRLIARLDSRAAAEAVIEHKLTLGSFHHSTIYVQEYVEKPGRDLRAFVFDGQTAAVIARSSEHWITNTARGATVSGVPLTPELEQLCGEAAQAVGGGAVAVDLFETERGLLVNEVNATMEFKNSIEPTGVDLPARLVDHVLATAERGALVAGGAP